MKPIVGLFTAWGNGELASRALENHMGLCDRVIVSVEPHCKALISYKDSTEAKLRRAAEKYEKGRIQFLPHIGVANLYDNPDVGKCEIYNAMMNHINRRDVIMIADSDEFYSEDTIKKIKGYIHYEKKYKWDMLRIYDMMFCINTNWYVLASHGRFIRNHLGSESRFYPTQNIQPAPRIVRTVCTESPMFHYSMLQKLSMRRTFWEKEGHSYRMQWLKHIYEQWDPLDNDRCEQLAEKNRGITNHKGFWFNDGVEEPDEPPYLFKFEGEHPCEDIEDVFGRTIKE